MHEYNKICSVRQEIAPTASATIHPRTQMQEGAMHPDYRFAGLSESLKNGFLSDEVVLAVARAQRGFPVSDADKAVFKRAVAVLDAAIQGYDWFDDLRLTTSTKHAATDFGRAVRALPRVHTSQAFVETIKELRQTAEALAHGKPIEENRMTELRAFFFNSSRSELDRTEELLSGGHGTDVLGWTASDE